MLIPVTPKWEEREETQRVDKKKSNSQGNCVQSKLYSEKLNHFVLMVI